jgi:hypothetical protein
MLLSVVSDAGFVCMRAVVARCFLTFRDRAEFGGAEPIWPAQTRYSPVDRVFSFLAEDVARCVRIFRIVLALLRPIRTRFGAFLTAREIPRWRRNYERMAVWQRIGILAVRRERAGRKTLKQTRGLTTDAASWNDT